MFGVERFITVDSHKGSRRGVGCYFVTSKVVRLQFRTKDKCKRSEAQNTASQIAAVR